MFSNTVMLEKATLDTEPHFSFLVLDPNQQELLLEDADFRQCYSSLLNDFSDRGVPHALLCTHGDTLSPGLRQALFTLPAKLGCKPPVVPGQAPQPGPGGVLRPSGHAGDSLPGGAIGGGPPGPPQQQQQHAAPTQRLPDVIRIVTNYVERVPYHANVELDADGNDVQQDIHTLLVLMDALRQADYQIMQRIGGQRPAPLPMEAELSCPLL